MRPFTLCCSRRHGRPVGTQIIPETELEQERFDAALRRKATQFSFSWKNETRRSYRKSCSCKKKRKVRLAFAKSVQKKPKNEIYKKRSIFTKHTITLNEIIRVIIL
jgi:ribosomal protein S8E